VTALIEGENSPLAGLTIESLMALSYRDVNQPQAPTLIEHAIMNDVIEEAVLQDQTSVASREQDQFNRKLEQIDRYLEDQILVLKRRRSALERNLAAVASKKEKAAAPSLLTTIDQSVSSFEKEVLRLDERIQRLQNGDDPDYQQWRDRLNERRFRRPSVERILEVNFRVEGGSVSC
jgi:predicted  nucleic acid-binding Zn-ribbon protein